MNQGTYRRFASPSHRLRWRGLATLFVFFAIMARSAVPPSVPDPAQAGAIALLHVTVIDGTGAPEQPSMTVVTAGGRIADIGKDGEVQLPQGVRIVDASGKFLIPGLIDMHVHTSWDPSFVRPMLLANGVTSVREMFAKDRQAIQLRREELARGEILGPSILAAGQIIDGEGGPWPGSVIVSNAEQARQAVDAEKSGGFDYVKVYSALSRDEFFAIADEAKRDNIPFAGHVPGSVSVIEASNAGQKSFEHLYGILLACSSREDELRDHSLSPYLKEQIEATSVSEQKAQSLFELLKKNGTWQTPTLVVLRNAALHDDPQVVTSFLDPDRLQYVPYSLRFMWALGLKMTPKMTPQQLAISRAYFQTESRIVRDMQRAGVGILAGTDTPNPYVYPGFALHDELELLVSAGLTPMEALETATRNPARFLGMSDSIGTIEKGKAADLVLLDSDPLIDIRNTRKIDAVLLAGKMLERPALNEILAQVKRNRWQVNAAAWILAELVVHMLQKLLYIILAALFGLSVVIFIVRKRKRIYGS
jgi:imidazolonepropionase-like amidohydrolase